MNKEILRRINTAYEKIYIKAKSDYSYNYYKFIKDVIDIWNDVRKELGLKEIERYVEE
jgi:hypothetical protein